MIRHSRVLLAALLLIAAANMFGFGYESLIPVLAVDVLGAGPAGLGLMISASSIGALMGALLLATVAQRASRHGLMLLIATAGLHLMGVLLGFSTSYPVSIANLIAVGAAANLFGITSAALLILAAPGDKQGRVLGIHMSVIGLFPLGALALGMLANSLGPGHALSVMAAVGLVITVAVALAVPELRAPAKPSSARDGTGPAGDDPRSAG